MYLYTIYGLSNEIYLINEYSIPLTMAVRSISVLIKNIYNITYNIYKEHIMLSW
jgi:hypothetical protein